MEMAQYVNSPAVGERSQPEKTQNFQTGRSKVYVVVGVSFGLLCMIQSALNVYFRLQRNSNDPTNVTLISSADTRSLLLEKDQLANENRELQTDINNLILNNEALKDQLSQQQSQTAQLQSEYDRLIMTLSVTVQPCQRCPPGWRTYMSSCYQLSTEKKSWENAREDCLSKGAHLVILNDAVEEDVLRLLTRTDVWIGLRRRYNVWKWEDGSILHYPNRIRLPPENYRPYCVFVSWLSSWDLYANWYGSECGSQHNWVCEKELK